MRIVMQKRRRHIKAGQATIDDELADAEDQGFNPLGQGHEGGSGLHRPMVVADFAPGCILGDT